MNSSTPFNLVVKQTSGVFGSPLNQLAQLVEVFNQAHSSDSLLVDLRDAGFVRPTLFLPLSALLHRHRCGGGQVTCIDAENADTHAYLSTILFPNGMLFNQGSEAELHKYHSKTYLPILSISTDAIASPNTSQITQAARIILTGAANHAQGVQNALIYLVSEALDNISQHSGAAWGWMQMQVYPNLDYADVCIADTGRTILGSYQDAQFDEVTDDTVAMMRALQGRSVKQAEMGRGHGIRSSRNMLQKGLRGTHFLWSGTAAAITKEGEDHILQLPQRLRFPGTMVALRIPLTAPPEFSIYDFV